MKYTACPVKMQYHEQVVNQTVLNSSFIYNNSFSNAFINGNRW